MKLFVQKLASILLVSLLPLALCSCKVNSQNRSSDQSDTDITDDSDIAQTKEEITYEVSSSETIDWSDWDMTEYNNPPAFTHWLHYTNDTCGYVSICDYPVYNSKDNPELFDTENITGTDKYTENVKVKRILVNVGDKFGDLTCTEAYITYTISVDDQHEDMNQAFLSASDLKFEGEAEVTGYIYRAGEEEAYRYLDELLFICTENISTLPYEAEIDVLNRFFSVGDIIFDSPSIYSLGIATDYNDPIIQDLPQGKCIKVKVKIKDIFVNYRSSDMGFHRNRAVISEIEEID